MIPLAGSQFQLLERTLSAANMRQSVIANNIANSETPYFKRSQVVFEDLLQNEMQGVFKPIVGRRTDPRHIYIGSKGRNVEPQIVADQSTVMNNNINNVDIDAEMALMAKNQLRYNTLIQQVTHDIKMYRTAVEGR
ncbi:flagellar basal body rod protein FlgB [Paenibacillus thermotolerans]|uniref:flagellar basal body rod protein FlgB n=1 Tax=Paenibacillus thermotolerans TaxID=3027807 RepID=UPI0023686A99|nr:MULTISPECIES: flagellar basal body rod protein FlgB [unclassified Paenibacillus]